MSADPWTWTETFSRTDKPAGGRVRTPAPPADDSDGCPECGAPIREKWSGVECSAKCGWWFCA